MVDHRTYRPCKKFVRKKDIGFPTLKSNMDRMFAISVETYSCPKQT